MSAALAKLALQRRAAPRIPLNAEVDFRTPSTDGKGDLADLSISGARIAQATELPEVGESAQLILRTETGLNVALGAHVVRHTADGFAVAFRDINPRIARLIAASRADAIGDARIRERGAEPARD